jgi:P-type Cu2+ transporter
MTDHRAHHHGSTTTHDHHEMPAEAAHGNHRIETATVRAGGHDHDSHAGHDDSATHAGHHDHGAHAGHDDQAGHAGHYAHPGHGGHAAHAGMAHTGHGAHAGHDKHAGHDPNVFRAKFWLSLLLTIPIVLYSEMVQDWLNFTMPEFAGSDWIAPVLGTFVFFYGGWVFIKGGWDEIQTRQPGMMLLISLAIIVAFVASAFTTFGWLDLEFWWELALLVTIMLLGHWLEMRAIGQAQGALAALAELLPDEADRITGSGDIETVPLTSLALNDVVLVRPGARVPADGEIVDGAAELDESMITGESRPVSKQVGDRVVAGTVAAGSAIRVRIDAVGEETALAGIQRLVADAQTSRSRAQALADRFAALLFYVALAAGIVTFMTWTVFGTINEAITRTVTVLVISCPHALGLAIPLVIAISTALSAKNGILVKDRLALERMRLIDTVLFDKTGTLTEGAHVVTQVATADGIDESELLATTASVERDSEHPLARAIVTAATERGVQIPAAREFRSNAGRGVEATVHGQLVAVGGPAMIRERSLVIPGSLESAMRESTARGAAVLHVVRGDSVIGAIALEDKIRPEAKEAIDALYASGVKVAMITGDAKSVAEAVGRELGVDEVRAEILPEGKQDEVKALQANGASVAMVGDGVNDAPALAQADVGIAIGAGTDVAIASAGVVLASSDPRAVSGVRTLSQESYRKMIQNLAWAVGYNVVAIPLAAGVLAPVGFVLNPAVGAVMMSLSTIVVAFNAQILRRLNLRPRDVVRT